MDRPPTGVLARSKPRTTAEIAAEVAAALMKAPRTMRQLREMVGISERHNPALTRYVEQFRAAGCVYVSGWTRHYAPIYAWQPSLFALPDVPRPPPLFLPASSMTQAASGPNA